MKKLWICCLLFCSTLAYAQNLTSVQRDSLQQKEQRLATIANDVLGAELYEHREKANYQFIKEFRDALKIPNSFKYDFPKLKHVKVIYPEDKNFRIFTWQIELPGRLVRHFGAIQMNEPQLKLFPLIDRSDDIERPSIFVGDNTKWYGALYYELIEKTINGHQKYFLIGLDTNHPMSTKKVIDVLQFNSEKKPVFGAPYFQDWKPPHHTATRFLIEYKGDATVSLNYDEKRGQIVMDHLVPMRGKQDEGIYLNYVPDGTFDALVWYNNQFVIKEDVIPTVAESPSERNKTNKESDIIYNSNTSNPKE